MFWIFPLILLVLFELIADIFSKEYALKGNWSFWILAICGYIVANVFWLWSIRTGSGLARGAIIFSVASAILAVLVGVYFFKEPTNRLEIIGIILGVLSIVLIFWE